MARSRLQRPCGSTSSAVGGGRISGETRGLPRKRAGIVERGRKQPSTWRKNNRFHGADCRADARLLKGIADVFRNAECPVRRRVPSTIFGHRLRFW